MLDVADDVERAAGIHNAATVILDLAEHETFDTVDVARLVPKFSAAAGRRVGWILENLGEHRNLNLDPLRQSVRNAVPTPSRLDPAGPDGGPVDSGWFVRENGPIDEESSPA